MAAASRRCGRALPQLSKRAEVDLQIVVRQPERRLQLGHPFVQPHERQAELLTVLALHPAGLSAKGLGLCLYGGTANPALHIGGHVIGGMIVGPLIGWAIASLIMLITKKVKPTPSRTAAPA